MRFTVNAFKKVCTVRVFQRFITELCRTVTTLCSGTTMGARKRRAEFLVVLKTAHKMINQRCKDLGDAEAFAAVAEQAEVNKELADKRDKATLELKKAAEAAAREADEKQIKAEAKVAKEAKDVAEAAATLKKEQDELTIAQDLLKKAQ